MTENKTHMKKPNTRAWDDGGIPSGKNADTPIRPAEQHVFAYCGVGLMRDKMLFTAVREGDGKPHTYWGYTVKLDGVNETAARFAGIHDGDIIIGIDRMDGQGFQDIHDPMDHKMLLGEQGSKVGLRVVDPRTHQPRDVVVMRDLVMPPVTSGNQIQYSDDCKIPMAELIPNIPAAMVSRKSAIS